MTSTKRLFSYEYQVVSLGTESRWYGKSDTFQTQAGADRAAIRWQTSMAAESCPINIRTVELVSDGRCGRVAQVIGEVV